MPGLPPPNADLAELVALLGVDNVRLLIRTFLREYPVLLRDLAAGDRKTRHRIAHSLKSNARVIGARALSEHMAGIEERLSDPGEPDLDGGEVAAIARQFEQAAEGLRRFAAE
jgi:HPt (histidine-containing phosphotransfer) domain-containing protein